MKDFVETKKDNKIDFVALYEKHKRKGATTTLMSLFAMGLSGCYETIGTTGVALDGPLSGATVFYDLNEMVSWMLTKHLLPQGVMVPIR